MKGWLGLALASVLVSAGVGAAWNWREAPVAVASPSQAPLVPASLPPAPVSTASQPVAAPATAAPVVTKSVDEAPPSPAPLDLQQAQQFMHWTAEHGDPRSPALGGLKPRQAASEAERADPRKYAALEERQTRELVQAYAAGVQQIPEIRARIEAAAQSGERSPAELDEARAALEQLEAMQACLEREAPELLPGSARAD
ncbi:hypothetical protein A7D27_20075 [Pseudomonas sp. 1D4]|uniref:hypothetical protein n=1 Tax=Pseudomonas sp. 1D4 TaxID=1843691 RepID=UPI00084A7FF9|nr:hypothetical protein [Pseudomonas sp. 1D4]OEC38974.1 hypothetical protein A7D27_20075 [Pseudomonas sp. 1D4]